jgi:hypothetical protein
MIPHRSLEDELITDTKSLKDYSDDELMAEVKRREELKYFVCCLNRRCERKVDKREDEPFCTPCQNKYDILNNYDDLSSE